MKATRMLLLLAMLSQSCSLANEIQAGERDVLISPTPQGCQVERIGDRIYISFHNADFQFDIDQTRERATWWKGYRQSKKVRSFQIIEENDQILKFKFKWNRQNYYVTVAK